MRYKNTNIKISLLIILVFVAATLPSLSSKPDVPNGPWVDEIDFFQEPDVYKAIDMIDKGELHYWQFFIMDPAAFEKIKSMPNIEYDTSSGIFFVLDVNPVPFKEGAGWNPFVNPRMREALNYIFDREYIASVIMKGLGKPKYSILVTGFPTYGEIIETVKAIEAEYKYNLDKGKKIIYEEMSKMGAVLKDGKWYYNGKLVKIKFLIRIEDFRKPSGDYIASQLEKVGFEVERIYRSSREASPIRYGGDPTLGQWHLYTGGYESGLDQSGDFWGFFAGSYIEYGARHDPLLTDVANRLRLGDYKSIEERKELLSKALILSLKDSTYVGIVDLLAVFPRSKDIEDAVHISAGPWRMQWARTIRFKNKVGGVIKTASVRALVEEWNPVFLGGWVYDTMVWMPTVDYAFLENPYANNRILLRAKDYSVQVIKGIPVKKTDKLTFVDEIKVPEDAISAWDPVSKEFVTVGNNKYAKAKVTLVYPSELGKYHDGSSITLADFMAWFGIRFELANNRSTIYDESTETDFAIWRKFFIAFKIIKEKPLTVDVYVNYTNIEPSIIAEWAGSAITYNSQFGWPWFPWHVLAIGILAEENHELAFSSYKARKMGIERTNYIGGPSLAILSKYLDKAIKEKYIPPWIKKYVTEEEAVSRYQNLKAWYDKHHHFWVSCGPFYLDRVDLVAHQAIVKAWREYPYKADRFSWLLKPEIPEASLEVPENIVPGFKAVINISVSFEGKPYPEEKLEEIKYVITTPEGTTVASGVAKKSGTGRYSILLDEVTTGKFKPGTYTLYIYAFSKIVAVPTSTSASLVAVPPASYFKLELSKIRSEFASKLETISTLNQKITTLEQEIGSLKSSLATSNMISILAIIIAVVSIVFAIKKKNIK